MKIAIVGCSRGIGLEFVKQLSSENEIFAFTRSHSEELAEYSNVEIIKDVDITIESSIKKGLSKVEAVKFDRLIIVSGILTDESLENWNNETITKQFMTNSLGVINCARVFLPFLNNGAKIGLLSSRMGSIEDNTSGGRYGYRMSKAALNAGGKSLAMDLKSDEISVFLLHPGYVRTDMTNHHGMIDPPESVQGLIKILNNKGLEETGSFWHTNGEELPW